jgi:hypothetical protein
MEMTILPRFVYMSIHSRAHLLPPLSRFQLPVHAPDNTMAAPARPGQARRWGRRTSATSSATRLHPPFPRWPRRRRWPRSASCACAAEGGLRLRERMVWRGSACEHVREEGTLAGRSELLRRRETGRRRGRRGEAGGGGGAGGTGPEKGEWEEQEGWWGPQG